jgi:hypothetical protein
MMMHGLANPKFYHFVPLDQEILFYWFCPNNNIDVGVQTFIKTL